ncbi:MAG TPA: flagellar hook-associated protein FlgK [Archangium sp.]|jgi:flagellar hook-associated protein 1 FlgK
MSGLLTLLSQGASSLQAQQAYSSTVAHNLSNSNTVGYSRQRAEIAAVVPADRFGSGYIGSGAVLQTISQARDRFLESQMPGAISRQMASGTESQTLQGVSALDLETSVSPALTEFYTRMRALAQNPGSANYREAAIGSATQVAASFNRSAIALDSARSAIDAKLEGRLPQVNQALQQVASLNAQIRAARTSGGEPNDLLDARQRLGDQLAEWTGAIPVPNSEGDLNLTLVDGTSLVAAERAASLSTRPDPANDGHLGLLISKTDGTAPTALTGTPGGELAGLLSARDGALKTAEQQLDTLAFDFASGLNAIAVTGVALDGSTGRTLFDLSATSNGAAKSLTVNAAIKADSNLFPAGTTSAPGDARAVQAMIDTEAATLSSGTNVAGSLARITAQFGAAASRAQAAFEGDSAALSHLDGLRQSTSGVSVDEELVNMQKAQRAYEAVTRVIKTADEMLQTLMSIK